MVSKIVFFYPQCCMKRIDIKLTLSTSHSNTLIRSRHFFLVVCVCVHLLSSKSTENWKGWCLKENIPGLCHMVASIYCDRKTLDIEVQWGRRIDFPKHYSFLVFYHAFSHFLEYIANICPFLFSLQLFRSNLFRCLNLQFNGLNIFGRHRFKSMLMVFYKY